MLTICLLLLSLLLLLLPVSIEVASVSSGGLRLVSVAIVEVLLAVVFVVAV